MKLNILLPFIIFFSILLVFSPHSISSQTCKSTCGNIPIKYPFGTGAGCGDPRFQPRVTCNNQQLTFVTHTGCYPITSIDYNKQVIYVSDPSMSTCSCWQPSKGFSLDWDAPFSFHDDTIFALLDCSPDSSPVYKPDGLNGTARPGSPNFCDSEGAEICGMLNSCEAVSRIDMPVSTCCVYTPVDLGPSFEMDLQKLQCRSYSSIYGFNGQRGNPTGWDYGIAIKYKFNFNNDYPIMCARCENSHGVCGYNGPYNSFSCNCPTGFNTTTDCFFGTWSHSFHLLPYQKGILLVYSLAPFIVLGLL